MCLETQRKRHRTLSLTHALRSHNLRSAFPEWHHGQMLPTTVMQSALHALRPLPDDVVSPPPPAYYSVPLFTTLNPTTLFVYVIFARVEPIFALQFHCDTRTRLQVQRKCIFWCMWKMILLQLMLDEVTKNCLKGQMAAC